MATHICLKCWKEPVDFLERNVFSMSQRDTEHCYEGFDMAQDTLGIPQIVSSTCLLVQVVCHGLSVNVIVKTLRHT